MKLLNSKIYKLIDNTNGNIYIGSTCLSLKERLKYHKCNYSKYNKKDGKGKGISSYDIIKNNDYKIELLEYFPCKTKQELLNKERHYIENNICININKPITTHHEKLNQKKEWKKNNKDKALKQNKEYRERHKDKIAEKKKIYYEVNKDKTSQQMKDYYNTNKNKIIERCKIYYEANKDKLAEQMKIYREANKDKINKKASEKIQCDNCSSTICRHSIVRHKKSLKCLNYKKD